MSKLPIEIIKIKFPFRMISKSNSKSMNSNGRYFLLPKYREFEQAIKWTAKTQYKAEILKCNLEIKVKAYFANKKHSDATNCFKDICDSLQGIIYVDDRQIKKASIEVFEDSDTDWFEVEVSR